MRKSLPRVISWCVIGLLTVAVFQFETGGRTPSGVASDATQLLRAQQLLRALYPELRNKNYVMSVEASGAFDMDWTSLPVLSVEIGPAEKGHKEYIADKSGTLRTVQESPVFGAMVALDTYGRVLDLSARARDILSGEKNEGLRKQVDSHRQWTSSQVGAALKDAGAKFGPDNREALIQAIPREALEPFIGQFQVDTVEFRLRHEQPSGSLAELYWEAVAVSQDPGGKPMHWSLLFEPFGGKLTSIIRFHQDR